MNDGPEINGLITNKFDKQNTPKTEVIEVNVTDPDGVSSVIISLGFIAQLRLMTSGFK